MGCREPGRDRGPRAEGKAELLDLCRAWRGWAAGWRTSSTGSSRTRMTGGNPGRNPGPGPPRRPAPTARWSQGWRRGRLPGEISPLTTPPLEPPPPPHLEPWSPRLGGATAGPWRPSLFEAPRPPIKTGPTTTAFWCPVGSDRSRQLQRLRECQRQRLHQRQRRLQRQRHRQCLHLPQPRPWAGPCPAPAAVASSDDAIQPAYG